MSEAEQKLCDLIARGFKTSEAAKQLGLTEGTAKQYRARNKARIKELAVERLHDLLPEAVAELAKLVSGAANENVKIKAIERVLTQAGLDMPKEHIIRNLTDKELNDKLVTALGSQEAVDRFTNTLH